MEVLPAAVRQWLSERNGSKRKLELLLGLSTLTAGYLYVWVYQSFLGVTVKFVDLTTLLSIPVVALIVFPLVHHLWVKRDLLQRGKYQWKAIQFFQAQFPSKYIKDRCQRCVETPQTCRNFIRPDSPDHVNYWLNDIWRGIIKNTFPDRFERTFERGYTCKLVFGLDLTLGFFGVLAILAVLIRIIYVGAREQVLDWGFNAFHIIYPAVCFGVVLLNRFLNKVDATNPTGCWQAW